MSAFFNQTCEYAIRAMMEVARRPQGEYVLAKELADKLDIPHHYLSKILQQLVRSRILESTRGRLGGFRLMRKPDDLVTCPSCGRILWVEQALRQSLTQVSSK